MYKCFLAEYEDRKDRVDDDPVLFLNIIVVVRAPGVGYGGGLYALGDVDKSWGKSAKDFAEQYADNKLHKLRREAVPCTAQEQSSVPAAHSTVSPPQSSRSSLEGYDSSTMFSCT